MRKRVIVAAMLASLAVSPASAGIIYTLTPETLGPLTATGTITTDGNLGILTAADITNVNITISGGSAPALVNAVGLFAGGFGNPMTALTATSSALMFNFLGAHDDFLSFVGGGSYQLSQGPEIGLVGGGASDFTGAGGLGNFVLASVAPAPGPVYGAGLPGIAFAIGGLLLWSRRRQRHAE